jgi:plasmid stabilization system protein ParE
MSGNHKELRLDVDAETDLSASVTFYRERGGEELAARFKKEVSAAFTAIIADPGQFSFLPELEGVQRFRLKHFPFTILYIVRPDHIWIVAVAHGSRKPGYWEERLV